MNETQFLQLAHDELTHLEDWLDDTTNGAVTCMQSGHVLTIETDAGEQIVVNIQAAMQEIWLASKLGGRHFRLQEDGQWRCTRRGQSLEEAMIETLDAYELE